MTFSNIKSAKSVLEALNQSKATKKSSILKVEDWKLSYAPPPEDILWSNLNQTGSYRILKAIFITGLLLIMVVFLSTPQHLVSHIHEMIHHLAGDLSGVAHTFVQYLLTLVLWCFTILLPFLVGFRHVHCLAHVQLFVYIF